MVCSQCRVGCVMQKKSGAGLLGGFSLRFNPRERHDERPTQGSRATQGPTRHDGG